MTLLRLAVLALLSSTAACTSPSGTATEGGRPATEQTAVGECGSEDPFASLVSQPTAQDVTMQQVAPEKADPGAFGEAALQVVNNSDARVGYGVAVILQRWEADAWTNVAQLNTSTGGRPDILDRCHPAYGTELSLGQEAPAEGSGPIETYSLPALREDATYRLVRNITTQDGEGSILVLEVASSAADPAPQAS